MLNNATFRIYLSMSSKADTNRQPSRRPSAKPSLTLSAPSGNGRSLVTDGTPSPTTRKHITNAHKQTPSQPMQSQPDDDISGPLPAISARPPAMSTRARALSSPSTPTKVRRPATAPSLAAPTSSSRGLPSPIGPRSKAAQGTGSPMSSGPRKHSSSRIQEEERPRTAEPNCACFPAHTFFTTHAGPQLSMLPILHPTPRRGTVGPVRDNFHMLYELVIYPRHVAESVSKSMPAPSGTV